MAKHRVLIIGVGSIGERHLRCFDNTGRTEMAFCEINETLRTTIAERYGITRVYPDLDTAIQDHHDAAVVSAPAHLHIRLATQVVDAGMHVLSEKPLSTSMDGVDDLVRAVNNKGLTAAVGYNWRCMPPLADARQAIASGRFGAPIQLTLVSGNAFYHHRPAYREIYFASRDTGGGAIQDAMTHMINAGEWLVGPIDQLAADASHQWLDGVDVEDTVHVMTRQGKVMGSYTMNLYQATNETTFIVNCEKATVFIECHLSRWRWANEPDQPTQDVEYEPLERDELYMTQANAFLDSIEGKGKVRCTLEEGVQTLRVNLATLKAADEHTWQAVRESGDA